MKLNRTLWAIQGLLAALFACAATMRLLLLGGSVAGAMVPAVVGAALTTVIYGRAQAVVI
jgi:hypothetical protein